MSGKLCRCGHAEFQHNRRAGLCQHLTRNAVGGTYSCACSGYEERAGSEVSAEQVAAVGMLLLFAAMFAPGGPFGGDPA